MESRISLAVSASDIDDARFLENAIDAGFGRKRASVQLHDDIRSVVISGLGSAAAAPEAVTIYNGLVAIAADEVGSVDLRRPPTTVMSSVTWAALLVASGYVLASLAWAREEIARKEAEDRAKESGVLSSDMLTALHLR